jgi:hypothetical protein
MKSSHIIQIWILKMMISLKMKINRIEILLKRRKRNKMGLENPIMMEMKSPKNTLIR